MGSRFHKRRLQPELMDDPSLDVYEHRDALAGLRRINWLSRSDSAIWKAIHPLLFASTVQSPVTILDIASGGGDLAVRLARRARAEGYHVRIMGCDISSTAIEFASEQVARAGLSGVTFHQCNVLTDPLPLPSFDVVMCSLFLHHLSEADGLKLLETMKCAAEKLVLVDDLRRSAAGYWLAWLVCRILTRCRVVHVDGPMSVEGALTPGEARELAKRSGMKNVAIKNHWPQRFLLSSRSE